MRVSVFRRNVLLPSSVWFSFIWMLHWLEEKCLSVMWASWRKSNQSELWLARFPKSLTLKMEAIRRKSRPLHGTETQKEIETDQQPPWIPKIYIGNFGNKSSHVNSIYGRISDEGYHSKSNHRKSSIIGKLGKWVHCGNIGKNPDRKYTGYYFQLTHCSLQGLLCDLD